MGETFDRVAIALTPNGAEYVVLEAQVVEDFGQGQGPKGGVVTVEDGWIVVRGSGAARLDGGSVEQGGTFPARLTLADKQGTPLVEIAAHPDPTGQPHEARIYLDGSGGNAWLGGRGADGDVLLLPSSAKAQDTGLATIHLSGEDRVLRIGTKTAFGDQEEIRLDGKSQRIGISGPDPADETGTASYVSRVILDGTEAGLLQLRDAQGTTMIELRAATGAGRFGGRGVDGDVLVFSKDATDQTAGQAVVWIRGDTGDIQLQNADCAEEFDVVEGRCVEPGTVVVLSDDGRLAPSSRAYDRRVAGVVSGAGGLRPGLVLGRRPDRPDRVPVTLAGRVCCKVEGTQAPVRVGDLLTTSSLEGHAMRVDDTQAAVGAILGKALAPLDEGRGLIPMLLALG